jgi:TP901 family phage tail tape measure protein
LAKEDDLSVNINIGVELNQQDVKNVKEELNNIKGAIEDINNSKLGPGLGSNTGSPFRDIQAAIEDVKKKYKGQSGLELKKILPEILTGGLQKELGDAWKNVKIGKFKPISEKDIMGLDSFGNSVDKLSKKLAKLKDEESDYDIDDVGYRGPKRNAESREMTKQAQESRNSLNLDSQFPEVKQLKELIRFFNTSILGEVADVDYNKVQKGVPSYTPGASQLLGIKSAKNLEFDILPKDVFKDMNLSDGFVSELGDHLLDALQQAASGLVLDEETFNALFDFEVKQDQRLTSPTFQEGQVTISPLVFSQILSMIQKSGLGEMIGGVNPAKSWIDNQKFQTGEVSKGRKIFGSSGDEFASPTGVLNFERSLKLRSQEEIEKLVAYFEETAYQKLTDILVGVVSKIQANAQGDIDFFERRTGNLPGSQETSFMANEDRKNLASYDQPRFIESVGDAEEMAGFIRGTVAANIDKLLSRTEFTSESFFPSDVLKNWLGDQLRAELTPALTGLEGDRSRSEDPDIALLIDDAVERIRQIEFQLDKLKDFNKKDAEFLSKQRLGLEGPAPKSTAGFDFYEYTRELEKAQELTRDKSGVRQDLLNLSGATGPAPDYAKIKALLDPLIQVFQNPKIVTPGLGSEFQNSVKGSLTTILKAIENPKKITATDLELELLAVQMSQDDSALFKPANLEKLGKLSKRQQEEIEDIEMQAAFRASQIKKSSPDYLQSAEYRKQEEFGKNYKKIVDLTPVEEFTKKLEESSQGLEEFRLLITGSREFKDTAKMEEALSFAAQQAAGRPMTLVHGDARGADRLAEEVAKRILPADTKIEKHPADWSQGKGAGMARNSEMVKATADLVLAFFVKGIEARGTGDTVKKAEEAGYKVAKFYSDGHEKAFEEAVSKSAGGDLISDTLKAWIGKEYKPIAEELKGNLQDFEKEQYTLRDIKRFGPLEAPQVQAQVRGGGSLNPDIELLRKYLTEQKALAEKQGRVFQVGLDTEFNVATKEKVTELGMAAVEASGGLLKVREIFKFFQMPSSAEEMLRGYKNLPKEVRAGQVGTPEALIKRAAEAGVPKEMVGDFDPKANLLQYRQKMQKLIEVLDLLSELGIQLTGNAFDTAEISNITKGIDYINEASRQMGLSDLKQPNFGNFFDPVKNSKIYSADTARPELRNVYRDQAGNTSASLNDVITRIANTQPAWFKQFESSFKMNQKGTAFEYTGAGAGGKQKNFGPHVAMADAAASAVISQYIKDFGGALSVTLEKVTNKINEEASKAAYSGSGGKPPIVPPSDSSDKGMADFGDREPSAIIKRMILTAKELKQPLSTIFTTMDGLKSKFPVLQKLTDAEMVSLQKRIEILQSDKSGEGHLQVLTELALKEQELADTRKEMSELSQGDMGFILQQRRSGMQGPLTENQTALKSDDGAGVKRYDDLTQSVIKLREETSKLTETARQNEIQAALEVVEISRKGHVTEQLTNNLRKQVDVQIESTQAGKTATSMIKAQMQEQVNAQKEVQKQTQSLMNTWVTSRYALYDVGNFYGNLSQQLFRVTREIFNTTDSFRRFETAFTSVERAMQLSKNGSDDLRNQFILLSETIPVSFEEISKIATLGAQMGITARGIVGFTETVAQFASVTGISADTVAQQFGRIAELADVDSSEFVNLGSAVTYAGINAVATESEILTLSQSIAAVSNQVGITAPEIIGIGTALASVGIPAEQARGVFTRVFADIDRAASTGGESLQNLAAVTGMSAEQIQGSWGKEGAANEVFMALLQGLDASENLTATFDALNIVETREINTLTRLAKNMNVVQQALADSGMAYEDGTFLGDSFGKTVDNIDSKIALFKNNLDSLLSTFTQGFIPTMEFALDAGSGFLKFLKSLEESFLLKGVLPGAAIFVALGGGMAGVASVVAKLTAQVYAFRVAMITTANNPTAINGFTQQVKALTQLGSGVFEMRQNVQGMDTRGLIEPLDLSTGENAPGLFAKESKQNEYLLKEKNLYVALGDVVKETNQVKELQRTGTLTDIQLARLEADAVNKAITARRLQIEQLENSAGVYNVVDKTSTPSAANLQGQRLRNQYQEMYITTVKGEITTISGAKKAALERLVVSKLSTQATKDEAAAILLRAKAVNLQTSGITRVIGGLGGAINKAFAFIAIAGTIITVVDAIATAIGNLNKIDLLESGGGLESLREAIKQDTADLASGEMLPSEVIAKATVEQISYKQVIDDSAGSIGNFTGVSKEFTDGFKDTTEVVKEQTIAIGKNTKEWLANAIFQNEELQKWVDDNPDVFNQMQESMESMGMTFDELIADIVAKSEGADVDPLEEVNQALTETKNKIKELEAINPYAMTDDQREELRLLYEKSDILQKIIAFINSLGGAITGALDEQTLREAINAFTGIGEEAEDTEEAVDGVAAAIRTVVDYASDLAGIFARAFEIRFGQQQSLDEIASGWADIAEQADSAKDAIKNANDEINELTADKSILEYQLAVAERYGDEKRAALIRAKLAKLNNSMADASENLADATAEASTETNGYSAAAIRNRRSLMGQLSSYASLVEMYAKTGLRGDALQAKVDELRESFLAQGLQAGFSNAQLQPYLETFDDMGQIIEDTPREVNVEFDSNISAARQALNEYIAKLDKLNGSTVTTSFELKYPAPGSLPIIINGSDVHLFRTALERGLITPHDFYKAVYGFDLSAFQSVGTTLGRAKGGIVLGPGSGTSDSIPAMLSNGEYVVRASAVNSYGLDFMNALNQQKVGFKPASQSVGMSSSSGSSVVYLSPEDRALLRAAVDRPINLYTDNGKIASSANAGNVLLAQRGAR